MRILFFGTPQTAVPFLEFLLENAEVAGIVTRPDQAAKRGQHLQKPPVKALAEREGLPILQPTLLRDPNFLSEIRNLRAEAGVVVAYGKILPKELIQQFPKGLFNVHFSLLPHLRGAAPIQWAILRGDETSGVTIFRISESLDTGNIVAQKIVKIESNDNAITLEEKLVAVGIEILKEVLPQIMSGQLQEKPQSGPSTYAPLLKKEDENIRWQKNAEEIDRQIRALLKWGASCSIPNGKKIKIIEAKIWENKSENAPNPEKEGTIQEFVKGQGFVVKCGKGSLLILKVQPEGKNRMEAWPFLQGSKLKVGDPLLSGGNI